MQRKRKLMLKALTNFGSKAKLRSRNKSLDASKAKADAETLK
jgi:hypothetical protein